MSEHTAEKRSRVFAERPTEWVVEDAWRFACVPLALSALCGIAGAGGLAWLLLLAAGFVVFFFRNPDRAVPGDERTVVAPADGRVIEIGEIEGPDGEKSVRIGIFLSIFNVHVNRAPLAGRVVAIERAGSDYRAAFDREAETANVRCTLVLETAERERVRVTQITGLVARRIVCHPHVGDWLRRGDRYGLIRFGSRTDVVLPADAELRVARGQRVRGGSDVVAVLPAREGTA